MFIMTVFTKEDKLNVIKFLKET